MNLRKKVGLSVKDMQNIFGFSTPNAIYKWQNVAATPAIEARSSILRIAMTIASMTTGSASS